MKRLKIKILLDALNSKNKTKLTLEDVGVAVFKNEIEPVTAKDYIGKWNRGQSMRRIQPIHLKRLTEFFQCSLDDLIEK